jgi:hypothetical protein
MTVTHLRMAIELIDSLFVATLKTNLFHVDPRKRFDSGDSIKKGLIAEALLIITFV